jgi:hypothetical protein
VTGHDRRGTSHRWENQTERTQRVAFILIDGAFTADLLATLGDEVLDGLLHDHRAGSKSI